MSISTRSSVILLLERSAAFHGKDFVLEDLLYVLRNNSAPIRVVLELRNLAYTDHAWALRFEELRQRDAEKVVRGLVEYVGGGDKWKRCLFLRNAVTILR